MKEHKNHAADNSAPVPTRDEIADRAYEIYVKEGRPQGRPVANWSELEAESKPTTIISAAHDEPAIEHVDKSGYAPAKEHSSHQNHHIHGPRLTPSPRLTGGEYFPTHERMNCRSGKRSHENYERTSEA